MITSEESNCRERLKRVVDRTQAFVIGLGTLTTIECLVETHDLCAGLPNITTELERVCLASVLLNLAASLCARLHAANGYSQPCACELTLSAAMRSFLARPSDEPRAVFDAWLESFVGCFRRQHPMSCAEIAHTLICSFPEKRWTVTELARRSGCPRRRLACDFRERWSVSIQRFIEMRRVVMVMEHIVQARDKLSYVAARAGYGSPKDFYRAVRNVTGLTPGGLRKQPNTTRDVILKSLTCMPADRMARAFLTGYRQRRHLPALRTRKSKR